MYIRTVFPELVITPATPTSPSFPQYFPYSHPVPLIEKARDVQLRRTTGNGFLDVKGHDLLRENRARYQQTFREREMTCRRLSMSTGQPVLLVEIAGQLQHQRNAVELAAKALVAVKEQQDREESSGAKSKRWFSLRRKQRGGSIRNQDC